MRKIRHKELSHDLRCGVHFAHPYHSGERGLNEHTNGLIRRYFPKETSFETLSQGEFDRIVERIRAIAHRTRKDARIPDSQRGLFGAIFALQV
jgi:IS30 family transposase